MHEFWIIPIFFFFLQFTFVFRYASSMALVHECIIEHVGLSVQSTTLVQTEISQQLFDRLTWHLAQTFNSECDHSAGDPMLFLLVQTQGPQIEYTDRFPLHLRHMLKPRTQDELYSLCWSFGLPIIWFYDQIPAKLKEFPPTSAVLCVYWISANYSMLTCQTNILSTATIFVLILA